jgi:hypothetical protein
MDVGWFSRGDEPSSLRTTPEVFAARRIEDMDRGCSFSLSGVFAIRINSSWWDSHADCNKKQNQKPKKDGTQRKRK